ncbi:MAG TPA: hypothetical protein ENK18_28220 [Deltaproteobacteria bacterium]|nr:hypothetical protein [Deltaproteobacteria bacterium]
MSAVWQPPPTVASLRPVRLANAVRKLRADLRRRDLLDEDHAPPTEADMEARAKQLFAATEGSGRIRLPLRIHAHLGATLAWMYQQQEWAHELQQIRSAIVRRRLALHPRAWLWLIAYAFDDAQLARRLSEQWAGWSERQRSKLKDLIPRSGPHHLDRLPQDVAERILSDKIQIDQVWKLGLKAGSPLESQTWRHLLTTHDNRWLREQPFSALRTELERQNERRMVGLVGRLLLEPAVKAGLSPADVRAPEPLASLVELIERCMPKAPGHPAWQALGPDAAKALRWWKTQHDLERFFTEWNADPDREAFWRSYVDVIRDVETYTSAQSLAMQIADTWFVEFGAVGNAAYAYSSDRWERAESKRKTACKPEDLKSLDRQPKVKRVHVGGWQPRFQQWIWELTEQIPNRRWT